MLQRRGQLGKKLQSEGHLKKPARRMKRLFCIRMCTACTMLRIDNFWEGISESARGFIANISK